MPDLDSSLVAPLATKLTRATCKDKPANHNFDQEGLLEDNMRFLLAKARQGHEHLLPIREDCLKVTACSPFSYLKI